jgi:hypothetical protein
MRSMLILMPLLVFAAPAEAAPCKPGMIYRPSLGICQKKLKAPRIYRAKASIKHRYRRPPVKKAIPSLKCDFACEVRLWAAKNKETFQ